MQKHPFKNIALVGFLIAILAIGLIQFLASRNITRLVKSNKLLLEELSIQNELRRIEADILTVESDVRGAVISGNPDFLENVETKLKSINEGMQTLNKTLRSPEVTAEIEKLFYLINEKLAFNRKILDAFYKGGKDAGEVIINTGRGKELRDSIFISITALDHSRQANISAINNSIGESGSQARIMGGFMAVLACGLLAFAFWYVMNLFSYQEKSIESLNESKQQIKEAAAMKEQFMANMSHEIRTPMNAIIGFTNILKRTDLDPQQRQYVQNIHTAGENLLALVNDILDLSKIEAGMMLLEEKNFSFRSLVGSVSGMFREKIAEKGLMYKEEIAEDIPDILCGDAVRLTQVLVNLLGNAIKFTETGEIRLSAQLLHATDKRIELQVKLADTGIGIAKEKQARIFERFQQAEAETTRKFGGTGLGLSIVRQIVEIQGGTLNLESEPGKGSEFTFTISYSLPDEEKMLSEALAMENDEVSIKDVQVLIAEDNPMNQQLIRHLMKNWEIQSTIVNNGVEAIEALKKESFSLVLMDIQMPEMDGYQAIEVIRKELRSDIPVIAMTAHAMMGEKEKCLQLGMNDYISKPLKETVLYNIIAQYSYYGAKPKT